ncbi:hypothetical protein Tco_1103441 [Tanacetum coccineum]
MTAKLSPEGQVIVWPKPGGLVCLLYVIKSPQSSMILPADYVLRAVAVLDFGFIANGLPYSVITYLFLITILKTNTPYPSRRYGVSVPELTKDHEGNKPIRRIQKKAIRRIEDIVCEDSGRYQSWSLLQETLIRRIQSLGYAAGEDMEEDTQADEEQYQSPPPNTDKSKPSHDQETQESECDTSSPELKKYDNILPLTERQLVKASIEGYYEENVDHKEQTDKVIDATMNSLDKNNITKGDLLNALNGVTETLKTIRDAVKEDLVLNKKSLVESLQATALKQEEHLASWAKSSTSMAWNLSPRMTAVESSQAALRSEISSLKQDTLEIKSMMTEIFQAFKGQEHVTIEDDAKKLKSDKAEEETRRAISISVVRPITIPNPGVAMIESSSRPPLTDPTLEILIPQREGKGIATDEQLESTKKLVPASKVVREDLDEPIRKAAEEAKMFEMTKTEVIKVVQEEVEKIGLDPKTIISAKIGEKFKKALDAEHQVLKREHSQKAKRAIELRKKRANDRIIFQVHNLFKFADFRVTDLDELRPIIQKKKNTIVKDLMISLGKIYKRLKKIPKELRIQSALLALVPEQALSESSGKKRKHMELGPKIKVPGLECNRSLPKGVPFVNNMAIEEPEYGIFFTDVFGDQAFQRWNDIHKVGVDSLVSYLVMALMVKTPGNAWFGLKLRKLIAEHLDQEKLQ